MLTTATKRETLSLEGALSMHLTSMFKDLGAKEVEQMTNVAWSALHNEKPSFLLDSEGVAGKYIEAARSDTMTADSKLTFEENEAILVSVVVALRGRENPEDLRNIADSLQRFLITVWDNRGQRPDEVFKLLGLAEVIEQAKFASYVDGAASLVNSQKFAIWIAYVRHICLNNDLAAQTVMATTLVPHFRNWKVTEDFVGRIFGQLGRSDKWLDVQHNGQLHIEGDREKKGGLSYVKGTESRGRKRGQEEASDLELDSSSKQKRARRIQLQRIKRSINGLSNINLMG
uniref:Uncharacterized protein n=1 Tax=Peronospora matthiolae TaxID=2874970 RepID=A0AAV1TDU1_9STRA